MTDVPWRMGDAVLFHSESLGVVLEYIAAGEDIPRIGRALGHDTWHVYWPDVDEHSFEDRATMQRMWELAQRVYAA